MIIVEICVGSSCYLKGSQEIVSLMEDAISQHKLEDEVVLMGSFCMGKCNRDGVTVKVNENIHVGVTRENFKEFFNKNVLDVITKERG